MSDENKTELSEREGNIKKLAGMIREIDFAMLTTAEADGTLRSRPMSTQRREFDGDLWFFTRASAPKFVFNRVKKSDTLKLRGFM